MLLLKFVVRAAKLGLVTSLLLSLIVGCNVSWPRWRNPGHVYEQQLRDSYLDPYASVSGGPEVLGGRPDLYTQPRALPVQSQWYSN